MHKRNITLIISIALVAIIISACTPDLSLILEKKHEVSTSIEQLDHVPEYHGEIVTEIDGGIPHFTDAELGVTEGVEQYAPLDELGRCGSVFACVTTDTMPKEERGDISGVHPSGWQQALYGDTWAYERCHLIAFCLTGEQANECNLITGTHALNQAMLPYEVEIAQDVERNNDRVLVRVTPVYVGDELVCRGVHYDAYSLLTDEICTNVFIHNVSDFFIIDYATGETKEK